MHLVTFIVVAVAACVAAAADPSWFTLYESNGAFNVSSGLDTINGLAYGYFQDDCLETGWGNLYIGTNAKFADDQQMLAAGYLEGVLTAHRISEYWRNYLADNEWTDGLPKKIEKFFQDQDAWMQEMVKGSVDDPYWINVGYVLTQMKGIAMGYATTGKSTNVTYFDLAVLNGEGDLTDIINAIYNAKMWEKLSMEERARKVELTSRCSVLVKVLPDYSDVYMGHTIWNDFAMMFPRIFKLYSFNLNHPSVRARNVSFASYPGFLDSNDDFYITGEGLVVTETTMDVLDMSVFAGHFSPQSALTWQRAIVANRMSSGGEQWSQIFSRYNSGTYNNEWIILDTKQVKNKTLNPGTLWILEQMPGATLYNDVTSTLEQGYWSSYNRPYYPVFFDRLGFANFTHHFGDYYDYYQCPRAQGKVATLDDFKNIMLYNKFQTDPLADGCPVYAIASRYDLVPKNNTLPFVSRSAFGGADCKVTNLAMARNLASHAICGPTHVDQVPFSWDDPQWSHITHIGHPTTFNYDWVPIEFPVV